MAIPDYFKIEVDGGRLNGCHRYYKSFASAVRAAKSILRADVRFNQFDTYIEIFRLVYVTPVQVSKSLVYVIK